MPEIDSARGPGEIIVFFIYHTPKIPTSYVMFYHDIRFYAIYVAVPGSSRPSAAFILYIFIARSARTAFR